MGISRPGMAMMLSFLLLASGCVTPGVKVGEGNSGAVDGTAGTQTPEGGSTSSGSVQLNRCDKPRGNIVLELSSTQNVGVFALHNIPADPLPAMRLIAQQSNCFRIVHRSKAVETERKLQSSGELREGSQFGKGQMVAADYTLLVEVILSNQNASGMAAAGLLGILGPVGAVAGVIASGVRTSEAGVQLTLIDNRSTLQIATSQGKATGTSFSLGGGALGVTGGALGGFGAGGYENTDQGKVVMGAMVDSVNQLQSSLPPAKEDGKSRRNKK